VEDATGRWRGEASWPPADSQSYMTDLRPGTYTDSGSGSGVHPDETQGIWTVSQPLPYDVWLSGTPTVNVSVDAVPNANLAANVYDVSPGGEVTMISRGVQLLRGTGIRNFSLELYGQDWPVPAGDRIAVLISSANDTFTYVPTNQTVTIRSGTIGLPFLRYDRTEFLPSTDTPKLLNYLGADKTTLSASTINGGQATFNLPPQLIEPGDEQ
jgi:hypothetical protein